MYIIKYLFIEEIININNHNFIYFQYNKYSNNYHLNKGNNCFIHTHIKYYELLIYI